MKVNFLLRLFISILGGSILALSLPGYNWWIIAWFGLSPFFFLINISKSIKEVLFLSFLFGVFYNFYGLIWLFSLHPLTWLGLNSKESVFVSIFALIVPVVYNALYFVLFSMIAYLLKNCSVEPYCKGFLRLLITTLIWLIVFNKISSSELFLGFPWTLIEYSQFNNLYFIQIAEYFGGIGIAFILVLFNLVVGEVLTEAFNKEKIGGRYVPKLPGDTGALVVSATFVIVLMSLSLVCGAVLFNKHKQRFSYNSLTAMILQGNLPIKATRGQKLNIDLAKEVYSKLSKKKKADLFIAPEGSLPTNILGDYRIREWLISKSRRVGAHFLFGSYCENEKGDFTNCAVLSSGSGVSYYEKTRLVPFGEYVPFYKILPGPLKKFADFSIGSGFAAGDTRKPLEVSFGKIGINICFELMFPELIRKFTAKQANLIINLSDLSWFNDDLVRKQFLAFGVFRAIENRKPVIIATNDGISAFIEPNGTIRKKSDVKSKIVFEDWITPNNIVPFYVKYGW